MTFTENKILLYQIVFLFIHSHITIDYIPNFFEPSLLILTHALVSEANWDFGVIIY